MAWPTWWDEHKERMAALQAWFEQEYRRETEIDYFENLWLEPSFIDQANPEFTRWSEA